MIGAEPARDLDQKLVAGAVAEAVVDLLEVVEVEKHHRQAVRQGLTGMKSQRELFLETSAIGQLGDGVEARHAVDFALGVAALGDVLDHHDGAVVPHLVDRDFDRPSVRSLDRHDDIRTVACACRKPRTTEERELASPIDAVPDEPAEYGARMRSGELSLRRHGEYACGTCRWRE